MIVGLWFRVQDLGFRVRGLGFEVNVRTGPALEASLHHTPTSHKISCHSSPATKYGCYIWRGLCAYYLRHVAPNLKPKYDSKLTDTRCSEYPSPNPNHSEHVSASKIATAQGSAAGFRVQTYSLRVQGPK